MSDSASKVKELPVPIQKGQQFRHNASRATLRDSLDRLV
jgi:hypothetical protein